MSRRQSDHEGEGAANVSGKILVEHTSINPNKAAHIGHLRNAILGDTFVRLLRAAGHTVDIQNYIDNTGVQVADVVVGFIHLEKMSKAQIEALITRSDRVSTTTAGTCMRGCRSGTSKTKPTLKYDLKLSMLSNRAVMRWLRSPIWCRRRFCAGTCETMDRLDIEYDFLPRESEILHLHFWDLAFQLLKEKGVLYFETEGKNKGCWVMTRPASSSKANSARGDEETPPIADEKTGPDEDAKVIVRSNGTVGYVGKDIAYHLWKFGLLGRDFGYQKFFHYPNGHECWISAEHGEA